MKTALIACRTGMGSSMMLKIKVDQVVRANNWDIEIIHGTLADVKGFKGDILITMSDVADELANDFPNIVGIVNLMNKTEIQEKLGAMLTKLE
ncbi:PTS sugar transporter subunit IIB [Streptococcus sp. A22]|uniref:PTS sugar transporter subunit IIB n=1 Tax=Streptococcus sp. A22 TaxID=3373126 RepID=UPI00374DF51F